MEPVFAKSAEIVEILLKCDTHTPYVVLHTRRILTTHMGFVIPCGPTHRYVHRLYVHKYVCIQDTLVDTYISRKEFHRKLCYVFLRALTYILNFAASWIFLDTHPISCGRKYDSPGM